MNETTKETEEMRPAQAARYAGMNEQYLHALIAYGFLPSRYVRGKRLIKRSDLDALIARREER